ncbi:hypothetical protein L873DRAFT_414790 [Choiromyces venosus 120613-1]|uniref:lytic cellulose monooxygenase (C4-dehydrogenating) n=1 Tax=Choiromyces venosus 120613-1 TaxID=1336337 RepID=A0A3N4JW18_9PEZI|nr:hypothetical protein L873DRAFT_414790 [Choiromyces venosus 120613-1]
MESQCISHIQSLQATQAGPGFSFEKLLSHSPARPSRKKPGSARPYPKPDGLAAWDHCITYLAKVPDAATATGFTSLHRFKIVEDGLSGGVWAVDKFYADKTGKWSVKILTNIPDGDYLLRGESIALHSAGSYTRCRSAIHGLYTDLCYRWQRRNS